MRQFVTVCVFCLLCATHSHCSSHDGIINNTTSTSTSKANTFNDDGGGYPKLPMQDNEKINTYGKKDSLDTSSFISSVFKTYGDGNTITQSGFERMLRELRLGNLVVHKLENEHVSGHKESTSDSTKLHSESCLSSDKLLGANKDLDIDMYKSICPVLLYHYLPFSNSSCSGFINSEIPLEQTKNMYAVWMYATLSIIVISLCGLGGVIVIPVMKKMFYQKLLQFLVALAVGTLCGDALLHLLPHAMLTRHSHVSNHQTHSHESSVADNHDSNMWRGLAAMLGIIFLYFTEKSLTIIADWRKKRQRKNQIMSKVRIMRDGENRSSSLVSKPSDGEKLCKHKYSSYPYCYGEITGETADGQKNVVDNRDETEVRILNEKSGREENGSVPNLKQYSYHKSIKANGADLGFEQELLNGGEKESDQNETIGNEERLTIILREHESAHHGHSHKHGHVHAAPTSLSSVAWMVVMGDGLHNFADGMAIGAAFATNIPGGFSTALAVFFHELPHELGDFAVLLQAGMTAKQAIFYNLLSSILCFVGMCFGVFLGHDDTTTQWVFSVAAGMFLYIALVDMIPELTSSHSKDEGLVCQFFLHFAGLFTGVGTMLLIALCENELKTVFID